MMFIFITFLYSIMICLIANSYVFIQHTPQILFVLIPIFLFINLFAGYFIIKTHNKTLKICYHGTVLLVSFYISIIVSIVFQIFLAIETIPNNYMLFVWSLVLCFCVNFIIFWNGIICVYLTSTQLGIKIRVIGIICGMIPIANLIALFFINPPLGVQVWLYQFGSFCKFFRGKVINLMFLFKFF